MKKLKSLCAQCKKICDFNTAIMTSINKRKEMIKRIEKKKNIEYRNPFIKSKMQGVFFQAESEY